MIVRSHQNNSVVWKLVVLIVVGSMLAGCENRHEAQAKERMMTTKQMTLWEIIDYIGDHLPLRRENIESLFGVALQKSESSNQFWTFWESTDSVLQKDIRISRILLGVQYSDDTDLGNLTLNIADSCITLEQIKQKYALQVLGVPRGRSLDEETTYESTTSWGRLVFGFSERNPDCLSSVGFGTGK